MNSQLQKIEVSFYLEGPVGYGFDPNEITQSLGIVPDNIRTLEDWPDAIKNPSRNLPEGIGPRVCWDISTKIEPSTAVSAQFRQIIKRLEGKEEAINRLRERHDLKAGFAIMIDMVLPYGLELVLEESINTFVASIGASVSFDLSIDPSSDIID